MRRLARLLAAVSATALVAGGCGSGGSSSSAASSGSASSGRSTTRSSTATSSSSVSSTRRRAAPRVAGPALGRAQTVHAGGATLSVTVTAVLDPLRAGVRPLPGTRGVGVTVTIVNERGATYDSTASGDVSVILSAGSANPLFAQSGPCETPLTDFESLIGAGETRSGCVAFAVPRGARVVGVRFSPHGRPAGAVSWRR